MTQGPGAGDGERGLVARAAAGDRAAFHLLYQANVKPVFGFLRARVDHHLAEDLTAEVFCRAFEHIGTYEWRGVPYRAWLLRIAYHLVVGQARRRSSGEVPVRDPEPPAVQGPEDDVVTGLQAETLLASLARLSAAHRTVLELRFLRDLSVAEAATVLDSTEEAVRALTYRALNALRTSHVAGAGEGRD